MSLFNPETTEPMLMPNHALPIGARVDSFRVIGLLGEGSVGIVYRAYDSVLQREVALKEYYPPSLVERAERSMRVLMRSADTRAPFDAGLRMFLEEARLLARCDHPALLKVHRFWQANGTAYIAMPLVQGQTLKQLLAGRATPPDEIQLRAWLDPLLDALAQLHGAGALHRDIAPENICITTSGPLLLDFGTARQCIGETTRTLPAMLRPGYTAIEQYNPTLATPHGPWTDLYALAGVVSLAIAGRAPQSAVERAVEDRQPLLWRTHAGQYGNTFLHALDTALAVRPEQRPQSVAQWRALMDARPQPLAPLEPPRAARPSRAVWVAAACVLGLLVLVSALRRGDSDGWQGRAPTSGGAVQAAVPGRDGAAPAALPDTAVATRADGASGAARSDAVAAPAAVVTPPQGTAATAAGPARSLQAAAAPTAPEAMLAQDPPSSSGRPARQLTLAEELALDAPPDPPLATSDPTLRSAPAAGAAAAAVLAVPRAAATRSQAAAPRSAVQPSRAAAQPPRSAAATPRASVGSSRGVPARESSATKAIVAKAEPQRSPACRALLQQASLHGITAAEVEAVKRECR